jgi:hypothetical protein
MAVVLGTSAGFVTVAPTANPTGSNHGTDSAARCTKDTCPAEVNVTEIGFYANNSHNTGNYEVGIYSHNGGSDTANVLLFSDIVNTTSGSPGWQVVSGLDWTLTEGVTYWIGLQVDGVAGSVDLDYASSGGRSGINVSEGSLPDPFASDSDTANIEAIYALVGSGITYSELSGTIAAQSVVSGNLDTTAISTLSGTIAATSTVGPASLGQVAVSLGDSVAVQRLVAVGNDRFYYEDI